MIKRRQTDNNFFAVFQQAQLLLYLIIFFVLYYENKLRSSGTGSNWKTYLSYLPLTSIIFRPNRGFRENHKN